MNEIVIGSANVSIKEYKGQRVVTFKDIDTVHSRPDGTARRNFNRNKEHFIEGEDFFKISSNEFRTAIGKMDKRQQNNVTVITESGYLMLAKSFTDKLAWDVQRALVKNYFRAKQENTSKYEQLTLEEKPYEYVDKFYNGQPVLTSADLEYLTKINRTRIDHVLRKVCTENDDYKLLTGSELLEFRNDNKQYKRIVSCLLVIFKSGFDKLVEYFSLNVETPKIMIEVKEYQGGFLSYEKANAIERIRKYAEKLIHVTYLIDKDPGYFIMPDSYNSCYSAIDWYNARINDLCSYMKSCK